MTGVPNGHKIFSESVASLRAALERLIGPGTEPKEEAASTICFPDLEIYHPEPGHWTCLCPAAMSLPQPRETAGLCPRVLQPLRVVPTARLVSRRSPACVGNNQAQESTFCIVAWRLLDRLADRKEVLMIELPDFKQAFLWENNFYLSCEIMRISKILAHYELFKMAQEVPGAIVECGVFKGASLARFAAFRDLFGNPFSKKIIGFDTFDRFPDTGFVPDKDKRKRFVAAAGDQSISVDQMMEVLKNKRCDRFVDLVAGDIRETVPEYVSDHPELKISLLNLDTDIYEPAAVVLDHLYPRIERGGVLILDDYGTFAGETKAVDEYFKGKQVEIRKFPFCMTPCYIVKK